MFGLFSKKTKKPKVRFIAYKSRVLKYKNVLLSFKEPSLHTSVLLVYFFDQTRDEVIQLCGAMELELSEQPEKLADPGYVLMSAHDLKNSNLNIVDQVIALEAHPLASVNALVSDPFEESNLKEIIFYVGMDESIISIFGGERITNILGKLGLEEDEPLEHPMITKSVIRGQERLESKIDFPKDIRTSQEAWEEANVIKDIN